MHCDSRGWMAVPFVWFGASGSGTVYGYVWVSARHHCWKNPAPFAADVAAPQVADGGWRDRGTRRCVDGCPPWVVWECADLNGDSGSTNTALRRGSTQLNQFLTFACR